MRVEHTNRACSLEASEKRYLIRKAVEIYPLESSSNERKYVLNAGNGRSFVISETLKRIIDLFREPRGKGRYENRTETPCLKRFSE